MKTTLLEENLTGRQACRKTSSQEDDLTGRQPHRKTNSQEDELGTAQPQLVITILDHKRGGSDGPNIFHVSNFF